MLFQVWSSFHPGQNVGLVWHTAMQDMQVTVDLLKIFMRELTSRCVRREFKQWEFLR
jgi:hypothetical protein